jgi:hypothetical protein
MTNRVTYSPHDFQRMCRQAERDQESKKLIVLMERVKRQIAERENPGLANLLRENVAFENAAVQSGKRPVNVEIGRRLPSRSAPFER